MDSANTINIVTFVLKDIKNLKKINKFIKKTKKTYVYQIDAGIRLSKFSYRFRLTLIFACFQNMIFAIDSR